VWANLSDAINSPERVEYPLIAFDSTRNADILVGGIVCYALSLSALGCGSEFHSNATWELQGGQWVNITSSVGSAPASNDGSSEMAYDPATQQLVLWTDLDSSPPNLAQYPQTWVLGSAGWTNLSLSTSSEPSTFGWIAYDPVDSDLVDLDSTGVTWTYSGGSWLDLGNWTELGSPSPASQPSIGTVSQFAWDAGSDRMVLYAVGLFENQTWTFAGKNWTNVTAGGTTPPGTDSISLFYDALLGGMVYYGAERPRANSPAPAYTWLYASHGWTNVTSEVGVGPPNPFVWGGEGAAATGGYTLQLVPVLPTSWPSPFFWALADHPIVFLQANPMIVEANRSVEFEGASFGGYRTSSFVYSGLPPGCTNPPAEEFSCDPTEPGSYEIRLNVTDSAGASSNATVQIRVVPTLSVTANESTPTLDAGQPWNLTVLAVGGLPSYSYAYSGLPLGCVVEEAFVPCVVPEPGVFHVGVEVTDSLTVNAWANVSVVVNSALTITLNLSESEVEVGETDLIGWNVSGGTAPVIVSSTGTPPGCAPLSRPTEACQSTSPGSYTVGVTAVDAAGESAKSSEPLTVVPTLTLVSFSVGPQPEIEQGGSFLFIVNLTNGIGSRSFEYRGLPAGCSSSNTSTLGCQPTTTGNWTVEVIAEDARAVTVVGELNVTVSSSAFSLSSVDWGLLIGGVSAFAVGAFVYIRRRKAGGPG
jgi:hypothetical protein